MGKYNLTADKAFLGREKNMIRLALAICELRQKNYSAFSNAWNALVVNGEESLDVLRLIAKMARLDNILDDSDEPHHASCESCRGYEKRQQETDGLSTGKCKYLSRTKWDYSVLRSVNGESGALDVHVRSDFGCVEFSGKHTDD